MDRILFRRSIYRYLTKRNIRKNNDKINWNNVIFDSSTILDFNGVDTNNIDNVIDTIDNFLEVTPRGDLTNISVTLGSNDSPSVTIKNSLGVSKTYNASYIDNKTQASFGENNDSLFTLIYGGVSDYYAASLYIKKDIIEDLFNESEFESLETTKIINFYSSSETLIYALNLYYQFEV